MKSSPVRTVAHKYGFTESEAKAVLFISAAALAGALLGLGTGGGADHKDFRELYRIMDSTFIARSSVDVNPGVAGEPVSESHQPSHPALVNINTAGQSELESLPGIGPVLAERIIRYRQEYGKFRTIHDIVNVKSIGEKKFEQLKPYISIGE